MTDDTEVSGMAFWRLSQEMCSPPDRRKYSCRWQVKYYMKCHWCGSFCWFCVADACFSELFFEGGEIITDPGFCGIFWEGGEMMCNMVRCAIWFVSFCISFASIMSFDNVYISCFRCSCSLATFAYYLYWCWLLEKEKWRQKCYKILH